jgi:hypothetical protein
MALRTDQFPAGEAAPQPPPDVSWLRQARERNGVTLEQIAQATKIRPAYLAALESGAVDALPAPFFIRGFVRAYAREAGLDPGQAADRYLEQIGAMTTADGEDVAAIVETAVGRTGVVGYDAHHAPLIESLHSERSPRLMLAAAAVGALIYIGPSNWNSWIPKLGASPAPRASAPVEAMPAPAPTPPAAPAPGAAPARLSAQAAGALQFEIAPQGDCWFSATADGSQSQSELLKAGDQRRIEARDALLLRVGDPAACAFSINGHAGRPLAAAGVPVTVRITKDNFKEFLGS